MAELAATRQFLLDSTKWFIDQDPTDIILTPRATDVVGPSGGLIRQASTPRASQRVKLIRQGNSPVSGGEGGEHRRMEYVIVFEASGSVAEGDIFSVNGKPFVVNSIEPLDGYQIKAHAVQHGKGMTDG